MDDQGAVLQLFELSQALEEGPAETASLEADDELDSLAKGEEFLEDFSNRVAAPDRAHPVDYRKSSPVAVEGGYELPDVFGAPTQAEADREQLVKALLATPGMQLAKATFVASVTGEPLPKVIHIRKFRGPDQLREWVKSMRDSGHTLASLVETAKRGGDERAAWLIAEAWEQLAAA
jgi:hypothetical protein